MNRKLILDKSGDSKVHAWDDLVAHGLAAAIFRAGEGLYTTDNYRPCCEQALSTHTPFSLYYAIHPWYKAPAQIERFLAMVKGFSAMSLMLDFELHNSISPAQIEDHYHGAYDYLRPRTNLPIFFYSGEYFIDGYCPAMREWIGEETYVDANYYMAPFNPQSWGQFAAQLAGQHMPAYHGIRVDIHQFAGDKVLPNLTGMQQIDYSYTDDPQVFAYLWEGGPRPDCLSAPVVPPINPAITANYVVANPLPGGKGTVIQAEPNWKAKGLLTVVNGTVLLVDSTWLNLAWVKVLDPVLGYCAKNRVKQVTP